MGSGNYPDGCSLHLFNWSTVEGLRVGWKDHQLGHRRHSLKASRVHTPRNNCAALQVDMLAHRFAPAHRDLGGVLAAWAVGTAVSGAADAIVSSVIYGEAAVLGPGYTHVSAGAGHSGQSMPRQCVSA